MSHKLLLADDSITIRKVVEIIFAKKDFALTVVDNGIAALEKAREIHPDVILADVLMPGKTGYEVSAEIRRDPALKHVPVLLLTGAFEPFDENEAKACGADDFIAKPFESQQLIEKVKSLIELGSARKAQAPLEAPAAPTVQAVPEAAVIPPPVSTAPQAAPAMGGVFLQEEEAEGAAFQLDQLFAAEDAAEALPADDLWDVFELNDIPEDETTEFEAVLEEETSEPFGDFDKVEAARIPEPAAPAAAFVAAPEPGGVFEFGGEFAGFAPETETGDIDLVAEEEPFTLAEEEELPLQEPAGGGIFEFALEPQEEAPLAPESPAAKREAVSVMPEIELEFAPEEEYVPVDSSASGGVFEFAAETEGETTFAGFGEPPVEAAAAVPEMELQFAPEEEYVPAFTAPPAAAPEQPAVSLAEQPAPAVGQLSEEMLSSVVARVSREVIERIAWEVVPDLAETLIREEIRKLKEGLNR